MKLYSKFFLVILTLAKAPKHGLGAQVTMYQGDRLETHQQWEEPSSGFWLAMENNCNLVLRNAPRPGGTDAWKTNTAGQGSDCFMILQNDCNLCVRRPGQGHKWCSGTDHISKPCRLQLQSDRNLVVYDGGNVPRWWSGTHLADPTASNCYNKCEPRSHGNCVYTNQVTQGGSTFINECASCRPGYWGDFCEDICDCDGNACGRGNGLCETPVPIATLLESGECEDVKEMYKGQKYSLPNGEILKNIHSNKLQLRVYYNSADEAALRAKMRFVITKGQKYQRDQQRTTIDEVYALLQESGQWSSDLAYQERNGLVDFAVIMVSQLVSRGVGRALSKGSWFEKSLGSKKAQQWVKADDIQPAPDKVGPLSLEYISNWGISKYEEWLGNAYEPILDDTLQDQEIQSPEDWYSKAKEINDYIYKKWRDDNTVVDPYLDEWVANITSLGFQYNSNSQNDDVIAYLRTFHTLHNVVLKNDYRFISMVFSLQHGQTLALEFNSNEEFMGWKLINREGSNALLGDRVIEKLNNRKDANDNPFRCAYLGEIADKFVVEARDKQNREFICTYQLSGDKFTENRCNLEIDCTNDQLNSVMGCPMSIFADTKGVSIYEDGIPANFQLKESYRNFRLPGWLARSWNELLDLTGLDRWFKFAVDIPFFGLGEPPLRGISSIVWEELNLDKYCPASDPDCDDVQQWYETGTAAAEVANEWDWDWRP